MKTVKIIKFLDGSDSMKLTGCIYRSASQYFIFHNEHYQN